MDTKGQTKYTFPKSERLTGKKSIEELFAKGSSFFIHPIVLKYQLVEGASHKILIAVSKKALKKAVDRNLVRRRIREAYRLNKHQLSAKNNSFYNLAFIYTDQNILAYKEIENKLCKLLQRLEKN
ncbi:MAG: ribonuclease P protein component [Cyclobacteriaceae bacterium]|nr:ribonuclease P protein component [Cyclobacteriaceae bacterium SS2]